MNKNLSKLFSPNSVAIVGASNTPGKVGYSILKNLIEAEFVGEIYPININDKVVQGIKAHHNLGDVKKNIDLVIICVPAPVVIKVMQDCVKANIKNAIIISAGFAETGSEGKKLQEELEKIVSENKINVVGPNTLGIINTENGLNASFASTFPRQGNIAIVSQSGALCTAILDWARQEKVGFSRFISTGNKAFLSESDYFDYLQHDPKTKAVFVYMESMKNTKKFLKEASELAKRKPVIVLKSGRSAQGQKAASSHTGALSVDDEIFSIACQKTNMIRVNSIEGFFDLAKTLSKIKKIKKFNLAVVTNAGGPGVIVADSASVHNFPLPEFSSKTINAVKEINPHASNPLDLIGDAKPIDYRTALRVLQDDSGIDLVYCLLTPQSMTNPERVADIIISLNKRKPIICSFIGGTSVSHPKRFLKENGVLEFETPERGIKALSRIKGYYERKNLKKIFDQKITPNKEIKKTLKSKPKLNLKESFELLNKHNIKTTPTIFVTSIKEIEQKINLIKFPVALKTGSGLAHKTDFGLVKANIKNKEELIKEAEKMFLISKEKKLEEILAIQEMIQGQEILVSSITNEFGKIITYGLGGIFVEIMKDVSQKIAPINESDLEEMFSEVKGTKVLLGARTKKKYNIDSLKKLIKSISDLALTYPEIKEIEFNPVIVTENDSFVVDCVINTNN
ncbi:MAG: CoA-binding protein [Candidatus Diapherotrites archaeon]|uniref:CoA-binding protein n=1 Tax=Candidatus Iainarchaeum sp. TaxID=3101447 RepID=A0A7K4BZG7_9ARCH|nr:CoA-binding protein [Candidatus Diapherotrites archaeon]